MCLFYPALPIIAQVVLVSEGVETVQMSLLMMTPSSSPHSPNAPVAASSKGMRAVKLCTDKILQFLTGGAG